MVPHRIVGTVRSLQICHAPYVRLMSYLQDSERISSAEGTLLTTEWSSLQKDDVMANFFYLF